MSANPVLVPTPDRVVSSLVSGLLDGSLTSSLAASVKRVLSGFLIGVGLAIAIGGAMGWVRIFEYLADPLVEALRPVPALAYVPLVIVWFGIGEVSRVLVISLGAFVTCVVNVHTGIKQVPTPFVEAAYSLGASRTQVFRTVAIPAAVPYIFAGMRVALAASWTTLVAAELIAAQSGLGYNLTLASRFFRTDAILATIIVIGLTAFSMDRLARIAQKRATKWAQNRE